MRAAASLAVLLLLCSPAMVSAQSSAPTGGSETRTTTSGSTSTSAGSSTPTNEGSATQDAPIVSCADVLNAPSASVAEIAALTDQSQVDVVQCRGAEGGVTPAPSTNVDALRAAASANPAVITRLAAAGSAPERVVVAAPRASGGFTFYVIGAYR